MFFNWYKYSVRLSGVFPEEILLWKIIFLKKKNTSSIFKCSSHLLFSHIPKQILNQIIFIVSL